MSITSTTQTTPALTIITQHRRITQYGRWLYQEREIRTATGWVQTLPWKLRFTREIERAR